MIRRRRAPEAPDYDHVARTLLACRPECPVDEYLNDPAVFEARFGTWHRSVVAVIDAFETLDPSFDRGEFAAITHAAPMVVR